MISIAAQCSKAVKSNHELSQNGRPLHLVGKINATLNGNVKTTAFYSVKGPTSSEDLLVVAVKATCSKVDWIVNTNCEPSDASDVTVSLLLALSLVYAQSLTKCRTTWP